MEKNERLGRLMILNFVLVLLLVVTVLFGTVILLAKLDELGAENSVKTMLLIIHVSIIVVMLALAACMVRMVQREERLSNVKTDKYKKLFMNLPIGFAQVKILRDSQTGHNLGYQISDANATFGSLFGLREEDYYDKVISESRMETLQHINAWFKAYDNSGTKMGELMTVEITMENLDKVFHTLMYKLEPDYINMVVIDITEQKETENKLSSAIEAANVAYRTQAEFLANMSHEIRTPINGILGMLQLTLMGEDLQADYRDNLIIAKNSADTLLRLVNDILDLSKLEAGKYNLREEDFDLKAVIEETVAAQLPAAKGKTLTLDCSFGGQIPEMVRGDSQRIQQVLNCLLSNAIKFTNEGGVRVKVACIDDTQDKIKLRIAVVDSGIGISDEDKKKLFIRFSQVDSSDTRKYGGSGLGLVITKQIIELMEGEITVQSKEGIGSTFIVEIPIKLVKHKQKKTDDADQKDPALYSINSHARARILVAEDEPVNQQVIGKLLGMAGYSYDIAENGERAVELYKRKEYQAALFDVQMPVMDGLEATQKIRDLEARHKKKRLPIIAVTARAMFGDKERILEAKLDDYIAKPYNLNDVVEILNQYVNREEQPESEDA